MDDRQVGELVDLVSLLEVRDLLREYGRQERAKELSEEAVERVMKTVREVASEPGAAPRSHDLEPNDQHHKPTPLAETGPDPP